MDVGVVVIFREAVMGETLYEEFGSGTDVGNQNFWLLQRSMSGVPEYNSMSLNIHDSVRGTLFHASLG